MPIGVVALVLAARLLPRGTGGGRTGHIDVVGGLLLGGGVLAVLLPLAQAESGGLARLWWLFVVGAALVAVFTVWERRVLARGGDPLLDPRLLTSTRGYATGAALGTVYFLGFSGIWLVFALFLQSGLGYTPLQSGLAVTAFALGSAVSAAVGGRLVERFGRRLTVIGLAGVLTGLVVTIAVVLCRAGGALMWAMGPSAADRRDRRRPGDLPEHHADAARGAGAHGRLGRRRAADRPAGRGRDRHGRAARRVLPGARRDGAGLPWSPRRWH